MTLSVWQFVLIFLGVSWSLNGKEVTGEKSLTLTIPEEGALADYSCSFVKEDPGNVKHHLSGTLVPDYVK